MFRDLAFYIFGTSLDTFVQYFVFELLLLVILGLIVGVVTKKTWPVVVLIIGLNLVDAGIVAQFNASQGDGTLLGQLMGLIVAKFFPTFYELLLTILILRFKFVRKTFKLV
ncbi:hypothetical protein [Staphylococcus lutrae]|uniref:Uncharacterized protein n=1 Tax=Staphylococcus lutrae TaxID=155085 RepID=A0AAC9RQX4_9STAP|nr:hypothetical protein [Staphylococcus lutrae]ARJ50051.1 hypothetical protein B5P37_01110 [Staphylococcus lutrae]PNZ38377.1 hypothetical protein CD134_04580 [Staphylococcus lutrae]